MVLPQPVDAIRMFHNAFRNGLERIDAYVFDTEKGKEESPGFVIFYCRFFFEAQIGVYS